MISLQNLKECDIQWLCILEEMAFVQMKYLTIQHAKETTLI